jgi:hypothetical protein
MESEVIAPSAVWDVKVSLLRLMRPTPEKLCFDSIFQYEAMEIAAGDPGSPGRHRDITAGLRQQPADGLTLEESQGPGAGLQESLARPERRRRGLLQVQRKMSDVDLATRGQHHRALDDVLELA